MTLSLAVLEAALSEIEQLGHDEMTFLVGKTRIWMRTLSPEEEHEVQQFASQAWTEDNDNDSGEALVYVDRFRLDTIARALVQVADRDLRGVEYIETGEKLPNGKPVKEPTHKVMRRLVRRWGGVIRTMVFKKYTGMLRKVEKRAEELIEFEPSDLETEISRVKEKLEGLEADLASQQSAARENPAHQVAAYGDREREMTEKALDLHQDVERQPVQPGEADKPYDPLDEDKEYDASPAVLGPPHTRSRPAKRQESAGPEIPQRPSGPRQSVVPTAAPPPAEPAPQPKQPTHVAEAEGGGKIESHWEEGGSFVEADSMADEVAKANARMAAARAAGLAGHSPAESALMAVHDARRPMPPHLAAAAAAAAVEEPGPPVVTRRGTHEGQEVFSLDAGTMSLDPAQQPQRTALTPQPDPTRGTRNPRFKGRRK